jgi:hypothetical protein
MPSRKVIFEMLKYCTLSLHTVFILLFGNDNILREILSWGRESSRRVQDVKISILNYVHIRSYLCFIAVVLKLLGHTLNCSD